MPPKRTKNVPATSAAELKVKILTRHISSAEAYQNCVISAEELRVKTLI